MERIQFTASESVMITLKFPEATKHDDYTFLLETQGFMLSVTKDNDKVLAVEGLLYDNSEQSREDLEKAIQAILDGQSDSVEVVPFDSVEDLLDYLTTTDLEESIFWGIRYRRCTAEAINKLPDNHIYWLLLREASHGEDDHDYSKLTWENKVSLVMAELLKVCIADGHSSRRHITEDEETGKYQFDMAIIDMGGTNADEIMNLLEAISNHKFFNEINAEYIKTYKLDLNNAGKKLIEEAKETEEMMND